MSRLNIYKDNYTDSTVVSNLFIDEYMKDANDAQLKVYLYLIRMLHAREEVSLSLIADQFNHTEKDVLRALKYWEKKELLSLDYDEDKNLAGIHMRAPISRAATPPAQSKTWDSQISQAFSSEREPASTPAFEKPAYNAEALRSFKERQETSQLLFVAESYIGRPLTVSEMKSILFFTDVLGFDLDLIDYLLQYCVDRNKKDFKYIEKVAVGWASQGISTPEQARSTSGKYDKNVYAIMRELGKTGTPTPKEAEYITRWMKDYGFSKDIIFEACERTVLATDKHRFEYADKILNNWSRENIHHKSDISRMDELHQQKKKASPKPPSPGRFHQFPQNQYDFDALEQELLKGV